MPVRGENERKVETHYLNCYMIWLIEQAWINLKIKNMKKEGREGGREEEKEERKKKQKKDSKLREDLTMKKQDKEIILGWGWRRWNSSVSLLLWWSRNYTLVKTQKTGHSTKKLYCMLIEHHQFDERKDPQLFYESSFTLMTKFDNSWKTKIRISSLGSIGAKILPKILVNQIQQWIKNMTK